MFSVRVRAIGLRLGLGLGLNLGLRLWLWLGLGTSGVKDITTGAGGAGGVIHLEKWTLKWGEKMLNDDER